MASKSQDLIKQLLEAEKKAEEKIATAKKNDTSEGKINISSSSSKVTATAAKDALLAAGAKYWDYLFAFRACMHRFLQMRYPLAGQICCCPLIGCAAFWMFALSPFQNSNKLLTIQLFVFNIVNHLFYICVLFSSILMSIALF